MSAVTGTSTTPADTPPMRGTASEPVTQEPGVETRDHEMGSTKDEEETNLEDAATEAMRQAAMGITSLMIETTVMPALQQQGQVLADQVSQLQHIEALLTRLLQERGNNDPESEGSPTPKPDSPCHWAHRAWLTVEPSSPSYHSPDHHVRLASGDEWERTSRESPRSARTPLGSLTPVDGATPTLSGHNLPTDHTSVVATSTPAEPRCPARRRVELYRLSFGFIGGPPMEPLVPVRGTPLHQRESRDHRKSRVNPPEGLFPNLGQSSTMGQTPYTQWQANLQAALGMAPVCPPQAIPTATSSPQPLRLVGQLTEPNHSSAVGAEPGPSVTPTMPQAAGYPIGTTPIDSISRIIISALCTHEGDGSEATQALGKLNIKVGPPPKYNGATDLKTFEQWVLGMVQWFRLHTLLGPGMESDCTRVNVIGYLCKEAACDWFHYEVETATGGPEAWTTLEVMQGLQARFITQRSAAEAAMEFCTLNQGTMDTQELYQELRHLALQLPHVPDTYMFACRYVEALNPRIAGRVYTLRYTTETHDVETLAKLAEHVEGAIRAQCHYKENRGSTPTVKKPREKGKTVTAKPARVESAKPPVAPNRGRSDPATRERRWNTAGRGGACHKCGRTGHFAAQCTEQTVAGKAAAIED
jgi:hypothetical protein